LEGQKANVESHIKSKKGELVQEFTDIASGKSIEGRPALEEAILLCIEQGYTLITAKADRLARNTKEALNIFERLQGRFVSCDCPETNELFLTMLFAFATQERKLISERTKASLKALKVRKAKETIPNWDNLTENEQEELLESIIVNGREKGNKNSEALEKARGERSRVADKNKEKYRDTAQMMRKNGQPLQTIAKYLNLLGERFGEKKKFNASSVQRLLNP
jgi:DNA invertase Pin-like site-specific DNA recombinase